MHFRQTPSTSIDIKRAKLTAVAWKEKPLTETRDWPLQGDYRLIRSLTQQEAQSRLSHPQSYIPLTAGHEARLPRDEQWRGSASVLDFQTVFQG
jgi:hypothetical protein